jgi:ligand-binding SRPBCC domain-containing protein
VKIYVLERRTTVPAPLAEAFAFFEDPRNLARITPPRLGFRITSPGPIVMRRGAEIAYRIRLAGLPVRWTTVIAEYDPPRSFVDEQGCGPYRFWRHHHGFEAVAGGTLVSDRVEYALPFGWLGRAAHALWVRRQLRDIFDYRREALLRAFIIEVAADDASMA